MKGATDLRPLKEQCYKLIDETNYAADTAQMQQLEELTRAFPVDHHKVMALLKSQLMCGNKTSAKQLIGALPDQRFHLSLQLMLWPLVVVLRILYFAWRLIRPVWQFGKLD